MGLVVEQPSRLDAGRPAERLQERRAPCSTPVPLGKLLGGRSFWASALSKYPGGRPARSLLTHLVPLVRSQMDQIQKMLNKPYKWGFSSDIESEKIPKGLTEDTVRLISAKKNEPEW